MDLKGYLCWIMKKYLKGKYSVFWNLDFIYSMDYIHLQTQTSLEPVGVLYIHFDQRLSL